MLLDSGSVLNLVTAETATSPFPRPCRPISVSRSHTYLSVMITGPLASHKHTNTHTSAQQNEFSAATAALPLAQTCLSAWRRCVAFINMRAVSVYPARCIWYHSPSPCTPPPPLSSHQFCGSVSWEPHKISLKTTRSAEANLWAPFILITTLWERLFNAICVIVCWTDCRVPVSLALHEKDIKPPHPSVSHERDIKFLPLCR